ncbi:MAG: MEMAR_RS02690 family S-layer glycoprotein, partial [Methanoregula sp.]|nr:MEMAR_RS02690 family S-layer glycoprotein [Methanoregula sp.]
MPVSAAYTAIRQEIGQGATVYIGEQDLNLQPAINAFPAVDRPTTIGWWASAATINTTPPSATYTLTNPGKTLISYAAFGSFYGNWYAISPATGYVNTTNVFMIVRDPQISVDIWDLSQSVTSGGMSVSGKSVVQGDFLGFKIGTNMDTAVASTQRTGQGTGWADIKVKTEQGNTFTSLLNVTGNPIRLTTQNISAPSWTWGIAATTGFVENNWSTNALDSTGQNAYPAGTYTVTVESRMNGMFDNYQNGGAAYTGKTVSEAKTVTLVSNVVKITANKDSVVRSKPFSVTVTGRPNTNYHLWIKGTSTMSGAYDNQPPLIARYQAGVTNDSFNVNAGNGVPEVANLIAYFSGTGSAACTNSIGGYKFQNSGDITADPMIGTIFADVAHGTRDTSKTGVEQLSNMFKLGNGTYLYANVSLADSGTRTVEFTTSNWTKAQKYTIRVEQNFGDQANPNYKSDEVDVKIEKGAVTIVAAGDQSYYLGEEIKFSGTNTETQNTYLFITGPNLPINGARIQDVNPRDAPVTGHEGQLQSVSVLGDNTWSWKWGTSNVALDAGTYTVWATSQRSDKESKNLEKTAYGTVSIIIKKPFISATASQSTVAQGDRVYITGIAEGKPSVGVQIWILGKNYAVVKQESVNADSTFSYEISREATKDLYAGQYFVVAQHPMQNNVFDVAQAADTNLVINKQLNSAAGGTTVFKLLGAGSLQGSDAAEALVQAINDANVDDTYTKLQFLIENPIITITPVGDRHVGDKFTIAATTNLAVDDEILCQVYSSSFKPTQKS